MIQQYDECIEDNVFFKKIQVQYCDLIERASQENWIICVPQYETLQGITLTDSFILEHILVPNEDIPDIHFVTLTKKHVNVQNNILFIQNEESVYDVLVLFKQTFYSGHSKYDVWCIKHPINIKIDSVPCNSLTSVHDCINLLWKQNKRILEQTKTCVAAFCKTYKYLHDLTLEHLEEVIRSLYTDCIDKVLEIKDVANKLSLNSQLLESVQVAVETYMQECIGERLFSAICTFTANDDAAFNKVVRNLQNLQIKDFDVEVNYEKMCQARCELGKINKFYTVVGKINCLKNTFNVLSSQSNEALLTSDKLLQLFTFLILKLNINNYIANLTYMSKFKFSTVNMSNENCFLITTLEAAIQYIKSGLLFKDFTPELENFDTTSIQCDSNQNNLFDLVRLGNIERIAELLDNFEKSTKCQGKLCHPLCSCDKCEQLSNAGKSCDSEGKTLLHIACYYGQPSMVDFLLSKGSCVGSVDYCNSTPLHLAASRGYQNCVLLLLHSGADINAMNLEGNTPLHLACSNGHENCVKALVYFSEYNSNLINLNCCNNLGNTPLHLASRWGFVGIIQILLQYGVDVKITNKNNLLAKDFTQNFYVIELLEQYKKHGGYNILALRKQNKSIESKSDNKSDKIERLYGIKPKTLENLKKVDLLLKSIENDDLPLTRFYLGVVPVEDFVSASTACHPLCTCEKCRNPEFTYKIPRKHETVNVNNCNIDGFTPIHIASKYGRFEILRLILDSGATVNVRTYNFLQSALHLACLNAKTRIVKELLKCGNCDVDIQDAEGCTPLHYAVGVNNMKIINILIKNGANVNVKNTKGNSPYEEAKCSKLNTIVKLFENSI